MNRSTYLLILLGTALWTACGHESPTQPDPNDFTVPAVRYQCGDWYEGYRPDVDRGLFDVFFAFGPDTLFVTQAQVDSLRARGGVIVHRFNVPAVRVIIRVDSLEKFVWPYGWAWGVPEADTYMIRMGGRLRTLITDEDRAYLRNAGVVSVLEIRVGNTTGLDLLVPDDALPALRWWDRWQSFSLNRWPCST